MTHYVAYLLLKCYHTDEIGTTPKDILVPFPPHGPDPIGYRASYHFKTLFCIEVLPSLW